MKSCLSEILSQDLPTYLYRKLLHFGRKAGLWNSYRNINPKELVRVYDLKNAGPRHRFTILGSKPFVVSNCVQSGGHDCFVLYLSILSDCLRVNSIAYKPYIWDLHDAVMLTVPEDQVEDAVHIMDHLAMNLLNEKLGGKVKLKGETNVVDNWAADKFG